MYKALSSGQNSPQQTSIPVVHVTIDSQTKQGWLCAGVTRED